MNFNSAARELMVRLLAIMILGIFLTSIGTSLSHAQTKIIVVLGDSLTAGYGLKPGEGIPAQLTRIISDDDVKFVDAGVSGDTSAGGLARLDWSVPEDADAVILELGANDALRAVSPKLTAANLEKIIVRLKARGVLVLLAGMKAPPNMGKDYVDAFDSIFPALAEKFSLVFYPFFLDGVAAVPELNQADGIHPTAEGVRLIAAKIAPKIRELIVLLK